MQTSQCDDWRTKDYLSRKDIVNILGITDSAAFNLIHRLPHVKVGKALRVSREAFQKWIKDQERKNTHGTANLDCKPS